MARELNGAELAGFIKERQAKQVRMLRQAHKILPKLVVIMSRTANPVIETYVRMKQRYATDILIEVEVLACAESEMQGHIHRYNEDDSVQGIIVQLPLDSSHEEMRNIVNTVAPHKDVDGLSDASRHVSATADAIDWLLAGYGVTLQGAQIAIVGQGVLVGAPLTKMWRARNYDITTIDKDTDSAADQIARADVIVSAAGVARLITSDMVRNKAVVVDAGTVSEGGVIVGDVDDAVRERKDVSITPVRGGVGPLTIAVLFDHLISECLSCIKK